MAIVFLISAGTCIASYGELRFNLKGFLYQATSLIVRTAFRSVQWKTSLMEHLFANSLNPFGS
jgi:hypothetical protein